MITAKEKQQLSEWLVNNLQLTSKSNVELIVSHVDHYFLSPSPPTHRQYEKFMQGILQDAGAAENVDVRQLNEFVKRLREFCEPEAVGEKTVESGKINHS